MDLYAFGGVVVLALVIALMLARFARPETAAPARGGARGPLKGSSIGIRRPG